MSKEVKRYDVRRSGMHADGELSSSRGVDKVVLASDYDALLAENESLRGLYKMHQQTETREMLDLRAERDALLVERDSMKALLISSREFVAVYVNSSFFGPNARKQLEAIDAAMAAKGA